ncbi:autophagocytosis associated protein [Halteromyces radiatus]|uniref:autophagocytosis associated protein n=1 Tax=Halteromyces radiatus TaxID=101107 RepID=UPI00222090AC|nr:autophagocytosis associated protein [Halteromyces radiatus]KAI8084603.1 autophagocytosis associated protein [Halteromyces radiatus]
MTTTTKTALLKADFELAIKQFAILTANTDTPWHLTSTQWGPSYLQRTVKVAAFKSSYMKSLEPLNNDNIFEDDDPALALPDPSIQTIMLDHHIVYSSTYQVPVLYFDAYFPDGTRLGLDEIYEYIVPQVYQDDLKISPIQAQGAITQADHPLLGRPFWYIHPCDTQTLLQTIMQDVFIENYIKIWLSLVGPLVRCSVSPNLFL